MLNSKIKYQVIYKKNAKKKIKIQKTKILA